jgi:hypothetical protein
MRRRSDLRTVQERVVDEFKSSLGVQAVMGMGSGKTVSALTAISDLLAEGQIKAAVVTAPRRVALDTWPKELLVWAHLSHLKMVVVAGTPAQRSKKLASVADIYVIGMDNLQWLVDELGNYPASDPRWGLLVIDELSRMKSPRGKRAQKLLKTIAKFGAVWGLTGTPRPNSEEDQWMPLQVVSAGTAFADSFDVWRRQNFMPLDQQGYSWRIHKFAVPILAALVDEWSFTIADEDASDVPFNAGAEFDTFVDLSPEAVRDLRTLDKELLVELGVGEVDLIDPSEELLVALSKAVAVGKMTQVMQGFIYREGETLQTYANPKIDALADLLEANGGDPVLVPYYYQEDLAALRGLLGARVPYLGAGTTDHEAARYIDAWNAGDLPVMPVHPASAGHGLNLQFGGRRLIWYHPTWSAELYAQTVKRLARPGQKRPVYSHRIRVRHWLEDMRIARVEGKIDSEREFVSNIRKV